MKNLAQVALLSLATVRAAEEVFTHDDTLKCGKCIRGGFVFCFEGTDGDVVADGGSDPTSKCCEDDQCTEASNDAYVCSNTYSDQTYALSMCPQKQDKCGSNQEVEFSETGETEEIVIEGMEDGDACTYQIKSTKGSPAFKVKDDSTISDEKVEISYIEYAEKEVEITDETGKGENQSPKEGRPAKDQSYEDSGNEGEKDGQKKPAREKADGEMTEEESVDEEKEYIKEKMDKDEEDKQKKEDEEKDEGGIFKMSKLRRAAATDEDSDFVEKPKPAEGEAFNETEAVKGYGKPTKGTYSADTKGYKTFGTEGQGENTEGAKDYDSDEEENRGMLVTVSAKADQETDTILLETGNYEFLEDYEWAEESAMAKSVSLTLAAVLSYAMI